MMDTPNCTYEMSDMLLTGFGVTVLALVNCHWPVHIGMRKSGWGKRIRETDQ